MSARSMPIVYRGKEELGSANGRVTVLGENPLFQPGPRSQAPVFFKRINIVQQEALAYRFLLQ